MPTLEMPSALGYRLRARFMETAVEEVEKVVRAASSEEPTLDANLTSAASLVEALVADFDKTWQTLLRRLDDRGVPRPFFEPILDGSRRFIDGARRFLSVLEKGCEADKEQIRRIAAVLDRIEPVAKTFAEVLAEPAVFDPERLKKGMEEVERGEYEDAAEVLERLESGGEL